MRRVLGPGAIWASVGAIAGAMGTAGAALAAPGPAWIVTPMQSACQVEIDLAARHGAAPAVWLESDGQQVSLRFAKDDIPASAFLPIRIDQKPFANLVQRTPDGKSAVMVLSEATQVALRRGSTLQIAWLADEVVKGSLAGSEQGMVDLRTCGAQVAIEHRAEVAAQQEQQARAEADARAKAMSDAQLATARAQTAAAEAERQRVAAEAKRASAEADRLSAEADRQRALAAESQREQQAAQSAEWNGQQPQTWAPYRQRQYDYYRGRAYDPGYDFDDN